MISDYLIKTYYKTAALLAQSLRGVCLIANSSTEIQQCGFALGQHLGMAFQLIDDVLDLSSSTEELGKDACLDLKEGHLTGPVLFSIKYFTDHADHAEDAEKLVKLSKNPEFTDSDIKAGRSFVSQGV
jgi:geranylgeranyl pyrophosphate synthase